MPSFYNGKRFFLTYPRCDRLPHELVSFLGDKGELAYYVCARELHADGYPHLHVCVAYKNVQRHDVRWFDFDGHHPNNAGDIRNWNACREYVKKGGDFIEGPEEHHVREALRAVGKNQVPPNLSELVKDYSIKTEWFDFCACHNVPFGYASMYWSESREDFVTIDDDTPIEGEMCESLRSFGFDREGRKTAILIGPSGCGKTTWAKTNVPKPAIFCSHVDDLKKFKPGFHKSIIFDDVDFKHWPRTSQIHIVDFENTRSIHVRYGTVLIPKGTYKIFTCNELPLVVSDPAIKRRVSIARVAKDFFKLE